MTETAQARPNPATNLPNLLTYGRILAVPALAGSLVILPAPWSHWIAFALFAAASITDFLDGYLARAWKQQSELGRMLDPIADKLLVGITILMLVYSQTVGGLAIGAAVIILAREIVVSGLREFLAELRVKLHVTWLSKWKTGMQMCALGVLLIGPALPSLAPYINVTGIGIGMLWIAAILTLYTGFDYLKAAVEHVAKAER